MMLKNCVAFPWIFTYLQKIIVQKLSVLIQWLAASAAGLTSFNNVIFVQNSQEWLSKFFLREQVQIGQTSLSSSARMLLERCKMKISPNKLHEVLWKLWTCPKEFNMVMLAWILFEIHNTALLLGEACGS
jgi:hypothetical protein